jgi:hypothetical protein
MEKALGGQFAGPMLRRTAINIGGSGEHIGYPDNGADRAGRLLATHSDVDVEPHERPSHGIVAAVPAISRIQLPSSEALPEPGVR